MKVLIITPFYSDPHRGVASAYKTAHELARHGMDVHVLTARTKHQPTEETLDGIRIHRTRDLFIPDPFNFNIMPNLWPRLWKILQKEQPDAVLISKYVFFTTLAAPLLRLKRQPFVITTDTFPGICWFSPFKGRDRAVKLYTKTLGKWLINSADAFVLLHENLLPYAAQLGLHKAVVIHGGVGEKAFARRKPPRDVRKRKGEVTITYIGRLESVKGWDLILEAAKRITAQRQNVRFLFVGHKQGKDVRNTRRIRFLGSRDDVANILAATDINVLFSYAEGLPNTVLEAMAAGVPVVASNVGGVSTLVKDGETGLLVPPADVDALVAALERLIDDAGLRRRLGAAGQAHVRKLFHWDTIAKKYEDLFRSIANKRKKKA